MVVSDSQIDELEWDAIEGCLVSRCSGWTSTSLIHYASRLVAGLDLPSWCVGDNAVIPSGGSTGSQRLSCPIP
jgi:hypothetical protein